MRKIAMRCTHEQFDSIKDRIKLKIADIENLESYPYLINYAGNKQKVVTNYSISAIKNDKMELYETFDAEIFLRACDSWEDEKTFRANELQYWGAITGKWLDCDGNSIYRFKPQPDYSKEIEALHLKAKDNGMKCVINFEKI